MPAEITMPQQSDTMTEGKLVKWNVSEGDAYAEGDVVAEIETDKATMEMEGPDEPGTVAAVMVQEGEDAPVGSVIAVIALEGEDAAEVKAKYAGGGGAKKAQDKADEPQATPADTQSEAARDPAEEPAGGKVGGASGGGGGGGGGGQARHQANADYGGPSTMTMDMPAADGGGDSGGGGRIKASPLARRIAENKGIDISTLTGTGPGGRVVQKDVLDFADGKTQAKTQPKPTGNGHAKKTETDLGHSSGDTRQVDDPTAKPAAVRGGHPPRVSSGQTQKVELTKMRQTIAKRLQQSKQTIPHFYETIDIDMQAAADLRKTLNAKLEKHNVRLSIGDLIAKAVVAGLKLNPTLNSTFDGTTITKHGDVNLGMAVALEDGLIVPVLRHVDQMGLREIRERSADLVDRARQTKLKGDEMTGATFTVSNLGTFGIKEFIAIVNPPEVGILAIGAANKRAVVNEAGEIEPRLQMTVTLSADHRVVDGADAARFLADLKGMLEDPTMMLV